MSEANKTEVQKLHEERIALLVQADNLETEVAERKEALRRVRSRLVEIRHSILGAERADADHKAVIAQIGSHVMEGLAKANEAKPAS